MQGSQTRCNGGGKTSSTLGVDGESAGPGCTGAPVVAAIMKTVAAAASLSVRRSTAPCLTTSVTTARPGGILVCWRGII